MNVRDLLKKDERWINIKDYGAGSKINTSPKRQVKDVIKNSAIAPATGSASIINPITLRQLSLTS